MANKYAGKVAVITGASSGIGYALAEKASSLGMRLALADIDADRLSRLSEKFGDEALVQKTDVADSAAVDAFADATFGRFGGVDLLFNNAGVFQAAETWRLSAADWRWVMDVNLMGVANGVRAFVPRMLAGGAEGHVVNTASMAGLLASPMLSAYTASKFAVVGLTLCLLYDLQAVGAKIGVSAMCPGPIKTEIFSAVRHRPEDERRADPLAVLFKQTTDQIGMSAEAMADMAFDAVSAGKFWIFSHPEMLATYPQLAAAIAEGVNPAYTPMQV